MQKSKIIGYALASAICIVLMVVVMFASIYPCGYWDEAQLYEEEGFAGYEYNSLAEVMGNGFFWETDDVPEQTGVYQEDGPYYVMGLWWISLLYIPMFLGIIYLGWIIAGSKELLSIFLPGC